MEQFHIAKGNTLYVEGAITYRSWEDQATGQKKFITEINLSSFQIFEAVITTGKTTGARLRAAPQADQGGYDVLTWFLAAPCRTSAQQEGAGIDKRGGMWAHMARIIGEVRPRYTFVENSPMLAGLDEFSETWPRWGMMLKDWFSGVFVSPGAIDFYRKLERNNAVAA